MIDSNADVGVLDNDPSSKCCQYELSQTVEKCRSCKRSIDFTCRLEDRGCDRYLSRFELVFGQILCMNHSFITMSTGEIILADGMVVKGEGVVDESSLTGESLPISMAVNSSVMSGTILYNGNIEGKLCFKLHSLGLMVVKTIC